MTNDDKTPAPSDDRAGAEGSAADAPTERLDGATPPAAPGAAAAAAAPSPATDVPPATETVAGTAAEGRRRRRTRNILIGAGAAVALLGVGGGAFALGAAMEDDDDDRPGMHAPGAPGHDDRDDDRGGQPGTRDDRGDDRPDGEAAPASPVDADADALREAAEAAIDHASAEGVTAIEIERGGYDVDTRLADGTEIELFVLADGSVRERGGDTADTTNDPLIDLAKLGDILAAAQSAAADAGATETTFHAITTSGSGAVYEIELRAGARQEAEVELDADLAVVRVDLDS